MTAKITAAVIIAGIVIIYGLWAGINIAKNNHFICKNCGASFKISKYKLLVTPHWCSWQYLTCPFCKKRSWMSPKKD